MAQLLPMSEEMIASGGSADWMARQAMRGLIRSGSRARARSFQVVPGSSSSWSMPLSAWSQAERVWWIVDSRVSRSVSPASGARLSSSCSATSFASPAMPTATGLVRPMRSGLISTWMSFAAFGQ